MFSSSITRHRPITSGTSHTSFAAVCAAAFLAAAPTALAQELVIGEVTIEPGITFIFEGAVRDHVAPMAQNLAEDQTHVHIEARVNWAESGIPEGTPPGGFVPYLNIHAVVMSESTGQIKFATLIPHINLIDNFHYARNIRLPGLVTDLYSVRFYVNPPDDFALARHRDWLVNYGERLLPEPVMFNYDTVDFREIATAPPRQ
ncbi:MAG: hypothetical protein F4018_13130 [Acidobacteria bacterium]|nr:hypothetical protein [Acidobacteriota bacterium]MYH31849.1 hypothetical protein [Acidobacteriota bacterium]MYK89194.1 hypothetical protein [Acidobacteriota bacterium]